MHKVHGQLRILSLLSEKIQDITLKFQPRIFGLFL